MPAAVARFLCGLKGLNNDAQGNALVADYGLRPNPPYELCGLKGHNDKAQGNALGATPWDLGPWERPPGRCPGL